MKVRQKYIFAFLLLCIAISVALFMVYFPQHWLTKMNFASIKVDDRSVQANLYIGNTTQNEADAIALVHIPGEGDYFIDFLDEKYRKASNHEFIRSPWGVWSFSPMNEGPFVEPLSSRTLNEFKITSTNGHLVTIQF